MNAKKAMGDLDDYGRLSVMSINEFKNKFKAVLGGTIKLFELMKQLRMSKSKFYSIGMILRLNNIKAMEKT